MNLSMNFSSAGLKEGLIKTLKVGAWVAGSGAVSALIAYVSKINISSNDVLTGALILVVNALLAGANRWLSTHPE